MSVDQVSFPAIFAVDAVRGAIDLRLAGSMARGFTMNESGLCGGTFVVLDLDYTLQSYRGEALQLLRCADPAQLPARLRKVMEILCAAASTDPATGTLPGQPARIDLDPDLVIRCALSPLQGPRPGWLLTLARESDFLAQRSVRSSALQTEVAREIRHTLLHELNGPLQTISSASHLLAALIKKSAPTDPEPYQKCFAWIDRAVREHARIAQSVLPQQAHENGIQDFDVGAAVAAAVALLQVHASVKGVELKLEQAGGSLLTSGNDELLTLAIRTLILAMVELCPRDCRLDLRTSTNADGIELCLRTAAVNSGRQSAAIFDVDAGAATAMSVYGPNVARSIIESGGGRVSIGQIDNQVTLGMQFPPASEPLR